MWITAKVPSILSEVFRIFVETLRLSGGLMGAATCCPKIAQCSHLKKVSYLLSLAKSGSTFINFPVRLSTEGRGRSFLPI